ncbi:MAG: DNA gyrase inhibitor YacG [Rhodobacteraceae bacterium]|nr:DNA gyrase inhibitor YacG [Paracoccaceae bacterium]
MACPICNKETVQHYRPFCSRRCADIDLGRWLTGSYVIPAEDENPSADDEPPSRSDRSH